MRKKYFDLQIFTDGGGDGAGNGGTGDGTGSAGNGNVSRGNAGGTGGGATYSYEQAEQIAEARADRATKAALADYFKQQGMSAGEVTAAIADYRTKKAANQPNVAELEKRLNEANAKVTEMENTDYLRGKGVKPDDLDYVLFKVGKQVDDKTDFKKAADTFLKENPRFTGHGYKVVSTGKPDGGSGTGQTTHDSINASIRSAFGR